MKGNKHYAWANDALENEGEAQGSYLNPQEAGLRQASIEAALALAFEQRTENLIAFWATIPRNVSDEATRELRKEILERLGL